VNENVIVNRCKQLSRTVSARISKEMHEVLRDKCNELGCSINDYIVGCIELMLDGNTDFDFGDDKNIEESSAASDEKKEIPELKPTKVSYDGGKTWIDLKKKDENPKVVIHLDD